jgi:hypothetical protein
MSGEPYFTLANVGTPVLPEATLGGRYPPEAAAPAKPIEP